MFNWKCSRRGLKPSKLDATEVATRLRTDHMSDAIPFSTHHSIMAFHYTLRHFALLNTKSWVSSTDMCLGGVLATRLLAAFQAALLTYQFYYIRRKCKQRRNLNARVLQMLQSHLLQSSLIPKFNIFGAIHNQLEMLLGMLMLGFRRLREHNQKRV